MLGIGGSPRGRISEVFGPEGVGVSTLSVALQRGGLLKNQRGIAGATVNVVSVQNKIAPPLRTCELRLVYGCGFIEKQQAA